MSQEIRRNLRVNAEVPLHLDDGTDGVTCNVSPSGVYFVVDEKLEAGRQIHFTLEFEDPQHGILCLECLGNVVRVEALDDKSGVAVEITESHLERRDAAVVTRRLVASR
jgi:hypothetical protein